MIDTSLEINSILMILSILCYVLQLQAYFFIFTLSIMCIHFQMFKI